MDIRLHELAKKLGSTSKDLLTLAKKLKIDIKSHMSVLTHSEVVMLEKEFKAKSAVQAEQKEKTPKTASSKAPETSKKVTTTPSSIAETSPGALPDKKPFVGATQINKGAKSAIQTQHRTEIKPAAKPPITQTQILKTQVPSSKTAPPVSPPSVAKPALRPIPLKVQMPALKTHVQTPLGGQAAGESISQEPAKSPAKEVMVKMPVTVGALATHLNYKTSELIKILMSMGIFANVNQLLNEKICYKVGEKIGIQIQKAASEEETILKEVAKEDQKNLIIRPPVVTLMGHVDHGKTSLLDAVRKSNLAEKEAGRITQHIGAYEVEMPGKGFVTFLDTPGHAAFTSMRARGANVTDAVVLVVAADDGVMPQTVEAIDHAREAKVPIIVAVNKTDLPTANPERVKTQLQKHNLIPEEWGGKTIFVSVSAKTGKGIPELLESLLLEAEILELKANPARLAQGTVIESKLTKSHGAVSTVLVQNGTLKPGDMMICGQFYGKIRALHNDRGKLVREAGPSRAVEIQGMNGCPEAGELFHVVTDEKIARKIAEKRLLEIREKELSGRLTKHMSLDDLFSRISEENIKELRIIIKADVQGSIEALEQSLEKIGSDKIKLRTIHGGVGGINESDIMLATASDAIIIGFHVKIDPQAETLKEKEGVDVRLYSIIYEAVDDVTKAMEGLLEPTLKEVIQGTAQVRQIFKSSKVGVIAGSIVLKGRIARTNKARVIRDRIVIYDGKIASLKRFKDDVKEVSEGHDFGISLEGSNDIKEGDIIEAYKVEKIAAKLI
ncbi:MAG: translation initiation factor IF-2 [Candidatus Omnitrophica bacterium]|nr:translation initiation factor IF-2 [Candidatus Omnitrophota bacterium]